MRIKNCVVRWVFKKLYHKWLEDDTVIAVKGWKSVLIETRGGQRMDVTIDLFYRPKVR